MNEIQLPPVTSTNRGGGLYLIKLSDRHYYGGRALSLRARWRRHLTSLERGTHGNPYMQAVFNIYRQFDPRIILLSDNLDALIAAEAKWLDENFGRPGCLNLSRRPTNNTYVSPEARKKISQANRGRKQTPEAIRRSAETRRGMKMSDEARRNNSKAQTGKTMSAAARRKMSNSSPRRGKLVFDSLRQGIIASNQRRRGETRSESTKQRIAQAVSRLVWVCCEGSSTRVPEEEVSALLSQGWKRGRKLKGH